MTTMTFLSKFLGLAPHQTGAELRSADFTELVFSRRLFLGTVGVAAALPLISPKVYSFAPARPLSSVQLLLNGQVIQSWEPGGSIYSWLAPATRYGTGQTDVIELRRVTDRLGVELRQPLLLDRSYKSPRTYLVWHAASYGSQIIT